MECDPSPLPPPPRPPPPPPIVFAARYLSVIAALTTARRWRTVRSWKARASAVAERRGRVERRGRCGRLGERRQTRRSMLSRKTRRRRRRRRLARGSEEALRRGSNLRCRGRACLGPGSGGVEGTGTGLEFLPPFRSRLPRRRRGCLSLNRLPLVLALVLVLVLRRLAALRGRRRSR